MKFSDLLGDPEPERELPVPDTEPISVFAPVPVVAPPDPPLSAPPEPLLGGRSGLAELNVRQVAAPPPEDPAVVNTLAGLGEVVDDLLPSARRRRK